jgi:HlyD family secretion protein
VNNNAFSTDRCRKACAFALVALAVAASPGCAKKAMSSTDAAPTLSVTTAKAQRGDLIARLSLTGVVAAKAQANLSSVITGQVLAVNVNVGDTVKAGQVLVQIDDSTLRAQLQQNEGSLAAARARLAQLQSGDVGAAASANANLDSARVANETAQANVRRNKQLQAQGYVSQVAVDDAEQAAAASQAQLRSAEVAAQNASLGGRTTSAAQSEIRSLQAAVDEAAGAVQLAQAQIAQAVVTAPFGGLVTQRSVDPGTLAVPGTPLVQVSDLNPVYVNVGIPEENLPYIHPQTSVDVTVGSLPGHVWHGSVSAVNSATTQGTLSYLARVILPNEGLALKAGMVANVSFVKAERRGVVIVPRAALFQGENGDAVYVLTKAQDCKCDGKAKLVTVRRGLETDTESEVSGAGIGAGTVVIVQRSDQLKDGSPVSVSSAGGQASAPPSTST